MDENAKNVYAGVDTERVAKELGVAQEKVAAAINTDFDGSPRTFNEWCNVHNAVGWDEDDKGKSALAELFTLAGTFEEWVYVFEATLKYRGCDETRKAAFAKMFVLAKTANEWARVYCAATKNSSSW